MSNKLPKMVGWYDPKQLWKTAGMMVVSTVIGENADPRLTNASLTVQRVYDYSNELEPDGRGFKPVEGKARDEIWVDYTADVDDGWDSTALVAHHIAAGTMPKGHEGRRGEILIFGGDEVYPTSSHTDYCEKLIAPYETAARAAGIFTDQHAEPNPDLKRAPHLFALPGNHDWYDSLNAFRYIFCAPYFNNRLFAGGWRTRQHRSYFALKLPHDWWLFGVDLQLTHNIDWAQLEYFRNIVNNTKTRTGQKVVEGPDFEAGSKVIICTPEPLWVEEKKYENVGNSTPYDKEKLNLRFLEHMIAEKGSEVRIYLAGGGGAFLHPTHDLEFNSLKLAGDTGPEMKLVSSYPEPKKSCRLAYRNLAFLGLNPKFGAVTATLYAVVVWLFHGSLKSPDATSWREAAVQTARDLVNEPWVVVVVAALVTGLIFFTDTNSKLQKRLGGALHAAAHLIAIFFIGWTGYAIYKKCVIGTSFAVWLGPEWASALTTIGFSFAVGWVVGSIIMGLYLLISLQGYGRHGNEAFSSLKIKDYKNFLRLHITKDGIDIYPIKIEKVPNWSGSPKAQAGDNDRSWPELIEPAVIKVPN